MFQKSDVVPSWRCVSLTPHLVLTLLIFITPAAVISVIFIFLLIFVSPPPLQQQAAVARQQTVSTASEQCRLRCRGDDAAGRVDALLSSSRPEDKNLTSWSDVTITGSLINDH